MKRRNSEKQNNIMTKLQKKIRRGRIHNKSNEEKTMQITGSEIMKMINKLQEQAFIDGYSYAIQLLKESIKKTE